MMIFPKQLYVICDALLSSAVHTVHQIKSNQINYMIKFAYLVVSFILLPVAVVPGRICHQHFNTNDS